MTGVGIPRERAVREPPLRRVSFALRKGWGSMVRGLGTGLGKGVFYGFWVPASAGMTVVEREWRGWASPAKIASLFRAPYAARRGRGHQLEWAFTMLLNLAAPSLIHSGVLVKRSLTPRSRKRSTLAFPQMAPAVLPEATMRR